MKHVIAENIRPADKSKKSFISSETEVHLGIHRNKAAWKKKMYADDYYCCLCSVLLHVDRD